jgi:hypothetical protein
MNHLANELMAKVEAAQKDRTDLEKLFDRASDGLRSFRKEHPAFAGSIEGALGLVALYAGASLLTPIGLENKIPELVGAAFGVGVGGGIGGTIAAIGGVGITMMGTGFGIPASAVMALGSIIGAVSGATTGWFGVDLATQAPSLIEMLFDNFSGAALIAFGCHMLWLAAKDVWKAGGDFVSFIQNLGLKNSAEGLS